MAQQVLGVIKPVVKSFKPERARVPSEREKKYSAFQALRQVSVIAYIFLWFCSIECKFIRCSPSRPWVDHMRLIFVYPRTTQFIFLILGEFIQQRIELQLKYNWKLGVEKAGVEIVCRCRCELLMSSCMHMIIASYPIILSVTDRIRRESFISD